MHEREKVYPLARCRDRRPDGPQIELTKYGQIAEKYIRQLNDFYDDLSVESYVIMPNHIHIMLWVKGTKNGPSRTPVPTV